MNSRTYLSQFASFAIILFVISYSSAKGPEPENPDPPALRQPLPQKVIVEEETIFSPAPRDNGMPPTACDTIHFLRYRPETSDGRAKEVRAILFLIPGLDAGASYFDYLGRNLVSLAENKKTGSIEVWALDRRGNCLEDLTGMNAAEKARDPEIAVNYYFFKTPVNGQTFQGFLASDDLPFLSEFGLQLLMEDIYTVIKAKIPDREDRQNTVFMGGHSFGGIFSALFAGWDFDGNAETTDDAGYNNCAGYITLDSHREAEKWPTFKIDAATYQKILADIRGGSVQRCRSLCGITPEALALLEIIGMYADWAPDEESTLLHRANYSQSCARLLCFIHSRNFFNFLYKKPSITDFRYTNEALLGVLMDDNFQPIPFLRASLGFLYGGAVVHKQYPFNIYSDNSNENQGLFSAADTGSLSGSEKGPLYSWVNFDEINSAYRDRGGTITYTTAMSEVSDIKDLARMLYQGPLNFSEWYYTTRITLDMTAARTPFNAEHGLCFLHEDRLVDLPSIEFLSMNIPGYNHLDFLCAAIDRPERRKNEFIEQLFSFMLEHSRGSVVPK
jgi:pimeloyl-ACP methyl ester carboxylesterase